MADKEKDPDLKSSKKAEESAAKETSKTDKKAEKSAKKESAQKIDPKDKEIKDLKAKNADLEDKFLRSQAEIQNMNNRHNKEVSGILKYDGQKLATEILPVLDNLERALNVEADDEASKQLKKGIEMVQQHMVKALQNNHVTEIDNAGEKFDPTFSQAVQTVPADDKHKKDTVVQVLQKGYKLEDRVLRPAMVVVAQ
ncbi:nucleotide exchange factor GrpE [Companilactobacillus alimentarius]|uniref:Protein GrpE n=1 Tax=Companilactobacillus alimentarius DSM 20249 TaxID=1423720 RepID=A0A2K9HMQ9_9LACO|nr:nucleotide exchange factor GrpE [Companilactobacillus alimentarius]AUI71363.1 nucleotide exchange factor GrpE [Companilactobacillus alimentarius DSM 20249]KRK74740.1 GrpE protein [Companilactobacillus alimentarius DSM 20249]MDT6951316.1 nucleotide exchange factor GrpE [Companilactobacillus alimentarius]GEO44347.1 protein GrpE [Companilactobacillus alimentarius]